MAIKNKYHQSLFVPKYPEKYIGRVDRIFARSGWERQIFKALDENPNVLKWASEELFVWYKDPVSNTRKRYYPDVLVKTSSDNGSEQTFLLEIKPAKETRPPKNKRSKYAILTFMKNKAKWEAAESYAKAKGWQFKLVTEEVVRFLK